MFNMISQDAQSNLSFRAEIDAILKQYGTEGKGIDYLQFREFMINHLGVSDTKDDILHSFKAINKGDESARAEKMDILMEDQDLKYFTETAKKNGDGSFDFKSWTDDVFSR